MPEENNTRSKEDESATDLNYTRPAQTEKEHPESDNRDKNASRNQSVRPSSFQNTMQVWLPIIFSGLLLVVVALQAYVYFHQWKVMQRQLKEMTKSSDAAGKSADAATKAANSAEESVKLARENAHADLRAWLTIRTVTMTSPLSAGTFPVIEARFENNGRTPAINVQSTGAIFSHATIHPDTLPGGDRSVIGKASRSVIGPGSGETAIWYGKEPIADNAQIESIIGGTWVIYVSGSILYDDIFGNQHRTTFCYELSGREVGKRRMSACFDGNIAD